MSDNPEEMRANHRRELVEEIEAALQRLIDSSYMIRDGLSWETPEQRGMILARQRIRAIVEKSRH